MVLYDENCKLDLEKFDIYNQYRDQICYIKVDNKIFTINIEPDDWQELKEIVKSEDQAEKKSALYVWLEKIAPDSFGHNKEFDFTETVLQKIIDYLDNKFT